MDKYEQFQIEQATLLKALAEEGPSESLARRMQALYKDVCIVIALGPTFAQPRAPQDEARERADERDIAFYVKALDSGALARIFAFPAWGEVTLEYAELLLEEQPCPGLRVAWSDKIAFLAEGKGGTLDAKIENMVAALARMVSARWYHWQPSFV